MAHIDHITSSCAPARIRTCNFKRSTLAAMLVAGTALGAVAPATAEQANINSMTFETESAYNQVVKVVSTDKQKWNKIESGSVQFWGHMKLDTKWPGFVGSVAVLLGQCGKNTCVSHKTIFADGDVRTRDYSHQRNFTVHTSQFPMSTGGVPVVPYGDQIVARCNQHLQYDGPTKAYSFDFEMTATFAAETGKKVGNLDNIPVEVSENGVPTVGPIDYVAFGKFKVKVQCVPVERETAEDVPDDENFKVTGVKLSVRSPRIMWDNVAADKKCRRARITVRVPTTKAGPVKFRLWTKVGSGLTQKQFVEAWSSANGSGFEAKYSKVIHVTETSFVQGWVEELVNPIGHTDGWKGVEVKCKEAATSGQAEAPKPANKGTIGTAVVDPRPVKPHIKVAPLPKLSCAGGKVWKKTCVCPRPTKKVKAGANAYRCIKTVDAAKTRREAAAERRRQAAEWLQQLRQNRPQKLFGRAHRNNSARPTVRRNDRESALRKRRFMR